MFIGHFGVGLCAKKVAPRISLGTLFLASQFLDLMWPTLLLFGVEKVKIEPGITKMTPLDFTSYPISHSLLMVCLCGMIFGSVMYLLFKKTAKESLLLGFCVVSHWILDFFVHRPDLPIYPGDSPRLGLGLWNSFGGTIVLESSIFIIGIVLYLRTTRAKNKTGTIGFWMLVGFLVVVYLGNIMGPPPPSEKAIAWVGQLQWIFVVLAYWLDRNRILSSEIGTFQIND